MRRTVAEDSVMLDGVLLKSPVDGKDDDSGTDKSRLSPVVHIEGDRVRIKMDLSVEDNSLDAEGVYSEGGSGILAGSNSIPTSLGI